MALVQSCWVLHCPALFQLMHKLSVEAPPKILVERYLIEIAKNYNVPYEPDSVVMVSEPQDVAFQ